jgi:sortase (surface protein transpeptidase)
MKMGSRGVPLAAGIAGLTLLTMLTGCGGDASPTTPSASSSVRSTATSTAPALVSSNPTALAPAPAAAATTSPPVSVSIPAIGVTSSLQPLGLANDGTLQSPSQWQRAGWYADGVRPGDPGPAVIAGHVDSVSGPAVFFRLKELRPGDTATVKQQNGHLLTFVVDTVQEYPKDKFPTAAVYGPTALQVLRLITCTGDFDRAAHSYVDNLVVSTHLVS